MKKVIMLCGAALMLLAVTAIIGKAAELTSLTSQTPSLDALAYDAISQSVLWSFGATSDDGNYPIAGLIADKWGNLYGTTAEGGANGLGAAFELSPPADKFKPWTESVLWSFGATSDDGQFPESAVLADKWGNLYGTTGGGGVNVDGTAFELSPPTGKSIQWSERVLWNFGATSDDATLPAAGLIFDKWGNLYGTTGAGGANFLGTAFKLRPPVGQSTQWSEGVLWSFGATGDDGQNPGASLLADKWGNLYGTTIEGGMNVSLCFDGCGTVFELNPPTGQSTQWSELVLWSFGATGDDGESPEAGLLADPRGNLYGTTAFGGANGDGTVFELSLP